MIESSSTGTAERADAQADARSLTAAVSSAVFRLEVLVPGLLALVLGAVTLGKKSWWFDEAYDVSLARNPWIKFIGKAGYYEPSQSLYLVLYKMWSVVTPESEVFTRLPSVLMASIAAALLGVLGTKLFGRTTGIVAGVLLAANAEVVALSQQTRTYSFAVLAAVTVTLLFLVAVESGSNKRRWIVYGIGGALGVYAHFFVGFVLAAHAVMFRRLTKEQRRRFLQSWGIVALAFLPALPFVVSGGRGGVDWIPPTSLHSLRTAVSTFSGFNALLLVADVLGVVAIFAGRTPGAARWKGELVSAWLLAPFVGAVVVSLHKPVLVGRYVTVAAPALALLAAAALVAIRPRVLAALAGAVILAVAGNEIVTWYDKPSQEWRQAAAYAVDQQRQGTTIALYPAGNYIPYQLYARLPSSCVYVSGHHEPRCDFRAAGKETLVLTTTPGDWRKLPGSSAYVLAETRKFGDVVALRLTRKPSPS